eukprot:scaffold4944_cov209-Pinguiococcus_pyrenoidosus.AAC.5
MILRRVTFFRQCRIREWSTTRQKATSTRHRTAGKRRRLKALRHALAIAAWIEASVSDSVTEREHANGSFSFCTSPVASCRYSPEGRDVLTSHCSSASPTPS